MNEQLDEGNAWAALASAWQQRTDPPPIDALALRAYVRRETTRMYRWLVAEIALSVGAVAFSVWLLVERADSQGIVVAMDIWAVLAIVWAFSLTGRRGLWKPTTESTKAFLDIGRRHALLKVRTAWLAAVLVIVQLIVALATSGPITSWNATAAALCLMWAGWFGRRARRETRHFDQLLSHMRNVELNTRPIA